MGDLKSTYERLVYSRPMQILIDMGIFCLAFMAPFVIRFEGVPTDPEITGQIMMLLPFVVLARAMSFGLFSVYLTIWRFVSVRDAIRIIIALMPTTILLFVGRLALPATLPFFRLPLSIISMEFMFSLIGTLGVRVFWRIYTEELNRDRLRLDAGAHTHARTILIGAGAAGNMVAKELLNRTDLGTIIIGFIDDNLKQVGKRVQGIPVLGSTSQIPAIARKHGVQEAVITIANASSRELRRITDLCAKAGLKTRIVPGLFELLDERVKVTRVREVNIDDLLGRSIFNLDNHFDELSAVYRGKRILVAGAGGSIGSELCRQLVTFGPSEIILLDKDENSIFEIDNDLKASVAKGPVIHPVIASIMNADRLRTLFDKYRPEIVFHAAAHKHVPLMEINISEAVLNNVVGTNNLVDTARLSNVERFLFISSDKAVNPTNVMGATKRIGEVIVQEVAKASSTKFACVRFGNVLGSRGSVIPLFQKQIAKGGPVTVTHPDVRRYFMSIPEAVRLIIQANTLGGKGEVFVLDMGEPIKILDMVKTLIRLSGHGEGEIEIRFVGMRPGEKLHEEILVEKEKSLTTKFDRIYVVPATEVLVGRQFELSGIISAAIEGDRARILEHLGNMGIGFHRENHA
jgi:FlaA1/EpsC-like NDP-sugar epimerase